MLNEAQMVALDETIRRVILQIGEREHPRRRALSQSGCTTEEYAKALKILVDIKNRNTQPPETYIRPF